MDSLKWVMRKGSLQEVRMFCFFLEEFMCVYFKQRCFVAAELKQKQNKWVT